MNINVLNELIKNFYLDNNEARQHAEDYYFSYLNENPSLIILLLFQNIKELKITLILQMQRLTEFALKLIKLFRNNCVLCFYWILKIHICFVTCVQQYLMFISERT